MTDRPEGTQPGRLKKRPEFLAVRRGEKRRGRLFLLEVLDRGDGKPPRFGLTVTKKVGNAVVRNRMKRRLRALVREVLPTSGVPGADHVLIGRAGGVEREYQRVRSELISALERVRGS